MPCEQEYNTLANKQTTGINSQYFFITFKIKSLRIEKYFDRIRDQLIDDRFGVLVIEISISDFVNGGAGLQNAKQAFV
jgi:hypothetical protein